MRGHIFISILLGMSLLEASAQAEEVLTWGACLIEAGNNHPDLISAQEEIRQSEDTKKTAASGRYPQIDSSLKISAAQTSGKSSSGAVTRATSQSHSAGITGTQILFDGAKISNQMKSAAENIVAARQSFRFVSSEIRYRLRSAFVALLKAQELLQISREIRQIRRSNLELIALRYESGIEHKGALMTAEANVAAADFEIARAGRALEVAQRQLLREMGRQQFSEVRAQGDFTVVVPELEKKDFEIMADIHPSLGKLIAQRNAAFFGIKSAEADFFPSLSATAGAGKTNDRWPPEYDQWNAGVTVSWPIFEGGLRKAELALAESKFRQLLSDELSVKGSLVVSLEQSWAGLLDAVEMVDVQKKFLSAYEARSRIAEEQYSLGLIKFDDWTIIEDNLVNAKKNFLEARANALQAEAEWIQAKGETLEYAQ